VRHSEDLPPSYRIHRWIFATVFAITLIVLGYLLVVLVGSVGGGLLSGLQAAARAVWSAFAVGSHPAPDHQHIPLALLRR
jgi:hypothetical protein